MNLVKIADCENIYAVDVFKSEYRALFGKSESDYRKHLKKLDSNLKLLDSLKQQAIQLQQFEKLEGTNLYSIRHVTMTNPRVIYAYIDNDGTIILLSACKEKGKQDYTNALARAEARLKQLEV